MKEIEEMKTLFDEFIEFAERFGDKQKEKQAKQWPKVGDDYWYFVAELDMVSGTTWKGEMEDLNIFKNLPIFKTEMQAEKYYSIIGTINNIVDELGRPSWEDFEDDDKGLFFIGYCTVTGFYCFSHDRSYQQNTFFPCCKNPYLEKLLEKVNEKDLLWAFKKSMRLV